jgi:hypothetical protein
MLPSVDTDLSGDPRMAECFTLLRQFARTVFECVERETGKRFDGTAADKATSQLETVMRARLEAVLADHVQKAFDQIVNAHPHGAAVGYTLRYPQRSKHLLRLLACAFSDLVAHNDDGLRHIYPKIIFHGLEQWAERALGDKQFADANQKALEALGRASVGEGGDDDQVVLARMTSDGETSRLYYAVFIPLLMYFSSGFDRTRSDMQRMILQATGNAVSLNAEKWNILFHRLFSRLFALAELPSEAKLMDEVFGEDASKTVRRIHGDYQKWLKANRLSEPKEGFVPLSATLRQDACML